MIPVKGQYVKIIFKNSTHADGIVEVWSDRKAVLKSIDGKTLLIIQDVSSDIMAIKVHLEPVAQAPKIDEELNKKEILDRDFDATICEREDEINEYLRAKNLIELRQLQAEQDKKIIAAKLKDHRPTQMPWKTNYELPRFFKKQSAK